ncbi:hypothetical protein FIBSPDRAFT_1053934 [Athelia psychrophila]|uniref:Fatty acid desaturase domain-containing protein n=1 Tax=Athelia psychrophila TaxID=1759441 RepID=A0A167W6D0_9AGAM|nr:hypothetical protein FIBSPDRAFT_1053934 [Fibularhizoctonia sp. CBS 109695]
MISPLLTPADAIVLGNLLEDVDEGKHFVAGAAHTSNDQAVLDRLNGFTDPASKDFETTIVTSWDQKDIHLPQFLQTYFLEPYTRWAQNVVRNKTDVVFLTHTLLYLSTALPSAVYLFRRFTYVHAICHWIMIGYYSGAFTLMLHNHIHNNGVLARPYALFDRAYPYVLEPLMGHTWDSYFYHHVKHHHSEGNGPHDLSSTVRYQRDELSHFLQYVARFILLVWIELPIYFVGKKRYGLAAKTLVSELGSYAFIAVMARYRFRAALFTLIIPLVQMRIAMMVGNWGQHAFVDELEPDSNYRSSITLIDVMSNRHCFNDGYHTSHHLNPLRHWREHPAAFVKAKAQYAAQQALVFADIDYFMMTVTLLRKDYDRLARCLVPIGAQIAMTHAEKVAMLKTKTRRFTEAEIRAKFGKEH